MKKIISIIIAMVLILSVTTACGNNTDSSEVSGDGIRIYLTVSSGDTFRDALIEAATKKAQALGATLDAHDAEGSQEIQMAQIREAVAGKYDVIMCNPVDVDITLQLQLEAGDIPMVYYNACPDESVLEPDQYVFVGSNEEDAGKYQAEYILEHFASSDTINMVIMEGQYQHPATLGRTNALKYGLEDSGKTINYVFDDNADWDTEKAKSMFEMFLKTGQQVDCVACNNDAMALGVLEVCHKNNIDMSKLLLVGVDATAAGCEAIESGEMPFTVYQSAIGQGEYAVRAAIRLAKGKSLKDLDYVSDDEKYVWVPFERVDISNVADYK